MRLFVFLLSLLSVSAQAKPKVVKTKVYIYTMSYAKGHKTVYLPQGNNKYESLALSIANIYGPLETIVSDQGEIRLCERKVMPVKDSEKTEFQYPSIAKIKIPSKINEPLIVLVPSKGDNVYDALVLDRDVTKFPKGSYRLVNFSSKQLRGRVGKTQFTVSPWKSTSFDPTIKNKEKRLQAIFQFRSGESWRNFGTAKWNMNNKLRTLLFSYLEPATGLMKIRGIPVKDPIKVDKKKVEPR